MKEAPKDYKHWYSGSWPITNSHNKPYKLVRLGALWDGKGDIRANAVGHIPLIIIEDFNLEKQEVDVGCLRKTYLPSLSPLEQKWINSAKSAKESGIACLYLAWKGKVPAEFEESPAMARKIAREELC